MFRYTRCIHLAKELMAELQALNQRIHLRLCVIHGEAGAAGGAHVEVIHEGLRAVVPCPHGNALFVQNR